MTAIIISTAVPAVAELIYSDDSPLRFGRFFADGKAQYGIMATGGIHQLSAGFFVPGAKMTGKIYNPKDLEPLKPVIPKRIFTVVKNHKLKGDKRTTDLRFMLLKPSRIVGHDGKLPESDLSYGAELVIVIGPGGKNIKAENAWDHIFGVTAAIAPMIKEDGVPADKLTLGTPTASAGIAIGPWMVPGLYYDRLRFAGHRNGQRQINTNTRKMRHTTKAIIEALSAEIKLLEGDVILTGTPGTMGSPNGETVMEVKVGGIGILRAHFTAGELPPAEPVETATTNPATQPAPAATIPDSEPKPTETPAATIPDSEPKPAEASAE